MVGIASRSVKASLGRLPPRLGSSAGAMPSVRSREDRANRTQGLPGSVREALGSYGGMTGPMPALRLMQAVRDQFDPDHRMSPGRFPAEGA